MNYSNIHNRLSLFDFVPYSIIENRYLPVALAGLRREYRLVPGDLVCSGDWSLDNPDQHVVYVKDFTARRVEAKFRNSRTGETATRDLQSLFSK